MANTITKYEGDWGIMVKWLNDKRIRAKLLVGFDAVFLLGVYNCA